MQKRQNTKLLDAIMRQCVVQLHALRVMRGQEQIDDVLHYPPMRVCNHIILDRGWWMWFCLN
jgi:hypothetical protein